MRFIVLTKLSALPLLSGLCTAICLGSSSVILATCVSDESARRTVVCQPLNGDAGWLLTKRRSTVPGMTSCTVSLLFTPVLAAQCRASRSQRPGANVTHGFSTLLQFNSKPSEDNRWLLSLTATFPVCPCRVRYCRFTFGQQCILTHDSVHAFDPDNRNIDIF